MESLFSSLCVLFVLFIHPSDKVLIKSSISLCLQPVMYNAGKPAKEVLKNGLNNLMAICDHIKDLTDEELKKQKKQNE